MNEIFKRVIDPRGQPDQEEYIFYLQWRIEMLENDNMILRRQLHKTPRWKQILANIAVKIMRSFD